MRTNRQTNTEELRTNITEHRGGFTLIEIILVLSIIIVLLSAAIYHIAGIGIRGKIARVRADFASFQTALNLYQLDAGTYPTTEQGLKALVKKPTTGRVLKGYRPSMRKLVRDPWKSPYGYIYPPRGGGEFPEIYSFGPDQVEGSDDDIYIFDDDEEVE